MDFSWQLIVDSLPVLLQGAWVTIKLTFVSVIIGIILGTILGIIRITKNPLRYLAGAYVDFIRGTPLMVQIFIIYYGVPNLIRGPVPTYVAAIVALGLNSSAYVAEIVRSGIQGIEKGQSEAALSLGLSSSQTMRYIVLPQAFRKIVPPLGNEFIALLKDSSLVNVIALEELTRKGQILVGRTFRPFEIWFAVAILYLIMTVTISRIVSVLERKLKVSE